MRWTLRAESSQGKRGKAASYRDLIDGVGDLGPSKTIYFALRVRSWHLLPAPWLHMQALSDLQLQANAGEAQARSSSQGLPCARRSGSCASAGREQAIEGVCLAYAPHSAVNPTLAEPAVHVPAR